MKLGFSFYSADLSSKFEKLKKIIIIIWFWTKSIQKCSNLHETSGISLIERKTIFQNFPIFIFASWWNFEFKLFNQKFLEIFSFSHLYVLLMSSGKSMHLLKLEIYSSSIEKILHFKIKLFWAKVLKLFFFTYII